MLKKEKLFLVGSCILVFILSLLIEVFWSDNIAMGTDATWYLFCYACINIVIFIFVACKSLKKCPKDRAMWIIVIVSFLWMCYIAFGISMMNMNYVYYKSI